MIYFSSRQTFQCLEKTDPELKIDMRSDKKEMEYISQRRKCSNVSGLVSLPECRMVLKLFELSCEHRSSIVMIVVILRI